MDIYLKIRKTFNNIKKEVLNGNGKQKPFSEIDFDTLLGLFCGLYTYLKRLKEQNSKKNSNEN